MSKKPDIALAGIGNLGWNLSQRLIERGFNVCQIIARKTEDRQNFARHIGADLIEDISELKDKVDLLFVCLPDDKIADFIGNVRHENTAIAHCSGYTAQVKHKRNATGVFYPFQTFTKNVAVEWEGIPVFIESGHKDLRETLRKIAEDISGNVLEVTHEQRKAIHISGVFGANFTNHLLHIVSNILDAKNVPFKVMKPLMEETIRKAFAHGPAKAQTGPAKRGDEAVLKAHMEQLGHDNTTRALYDLFTTGITKEHRTA